MGYFIPAHNGVGSGQMEKLSALSRRRRRRHLELQIDIQGRKLYLQVFLCFGGHGESSRGMETGVVHTILPSVSCA